MGRREPFLGSVEDLLVLGPSPDLASDNEGVVLMVHKDRNGDRHAVFVPDSMALPWRRLSVTQREPLLEISGHVRVVWEANSAIRDAVAEARSLGVSWENIGIALGTTGRSASQRFGGDPEA